MKFTYEELFEDDGYVCDWMTNTDKLEILDFQTAILDLKAVKEGAECDFDVDSITSRICEHFGKSIEELWLQEAIV